MRDQIGNRFDGGRHAAIDLAAEAEKLHGDGKAEQAAKAAGFEVK